MAVNEDLVKKLRATRADYLEEAAWHKFLLDSAYSTGGYKGKFGPTEISQLGWAAEAYARVVALRPSQFGVVDKRQTYLDQFAREDDKKFSKRIDVSHYTNYVAPIFGLLLGYINKTEMHLDEMPETVAEWAENVDGKGLPWSVLQASTVRLRAALLGWCPVLFDWGEPENGELVTGEISQARRRELGISVQAIPLFPINVLDWTRDRDGDVNAMKIRTDHVVKNDLLGECIREERYALWYRDRVINYTITVDEKGQESVSAPEEKTHDYGCVPVVIWHGIPTADDKVRGLSIVGDLAVANRRYFNLESEMDDHIRGQVFATLGIPVESMKTDINEIVGGNNNAIKIPMQSNMPLHYAAPPEGVAKTLESRLLASEKTMYRTQRIEHDAPTVQTSGISRAYQFEQTNRRLGDLAGGFARSEQKGLRLVGKALAAANAETLKATAPTDFSLEDLAADIENTLQALGLSLGPTADKELRKRAARNLLKNLPKETMDQIHEELEEQAKQDEQDDALDREVKRAGADAAIAEGKSVASGANPGTPVPGQQTEEAA